MYFEVVQYFLFVPYFESVQLKSLMPGSDDTISARQTFTVHYDVFISCSVTSSNISDLASGMLHYHDAESLACQSFFCLFSPGVTCLMTSALALTNRKMECHPLRGQECDHWRTNVKKTCF